MFAAANVRLAVLFALSGILASASPLSLRASSSLLDGLSAQCTATLTSILYSPDTSQCLQLGSLITSLTTLNQSASLIPVFDTYASQLCPAPACSNSTLTSASAAINSSCATSTATNYLPALLTLVLDNFDAVKNASCLTNNGTNCIVETAKNIEGATKVNVSIDEINYLSSTETQNSYYWFEEIVNNSTATCTTCNQGIYAFIWPIASKKLAPATTDIFQQHVSTTCGASFFNGTVPSSLVETANLKPNNSTSGAGSSSGSSSGQTTGSGTSGTNAGVKINSAFGTSILLGLSVVVAIVFV